MVSKRPVALPSGQSVSIMGTPHLFRVTFWLLFALLGLSYGLDFVIDWSTSVPGVDVLLHFLGGAWAAIAFFMLCGHLFDGRIFSNTWESSKILLLSISFAAFVGVLWEFHEFILSSVFGAYLQPSLPDTLGDLLMDILGGTVLGLLFLFSGSARKE